MVPAKREGESLCAIINAANPPKKRGPHRRAVALMDRPNAVWLAMMAITITYLIFCALVFRRLRLFHLETWEKLGKPSLFLNNSILTTFKFIPFLFRGDYRRLEDGSLTWMGNATLGLFCCWAFLFVTMLATILR